MGGKLGMASDESIVTPSEHDPGIILDEREGVSVEIPKHGVAAPASNDSNFVGVNSPEEQSHGAAGPKGASGDFIGVDASVARNGEGGRSEEGRDHCAGYRAFAAGIIKVNMERGCDWSMMVFKMSYTPKRGSDRASKRLSIGSVGQLLTFHAILLRGECERYIRCG